MSRFLILFLISIPPAVLLVFLVSLSFPKEYNIANYVSGAKPIYWGSSVSPSGLYQGNSFTYGYDDRYNYFRIIVVNLLNGLKKEVYRGDYHTLGWEWLSDDKIKVDWDCGTGCIASKAFRVDDGLSLADYASEGAMSSANGWEVKFYKSF